MNSSNRVARSGTAERTKVTIGGVPKWPANPAHRER